MKKKIFSFIAAAAIAVSSVIPSYAMTTEEIIAGWEGVIDLSVDPTHDDLLKVTGTEGSKDDVFAKIETVINSVGLLHASGLDHGYYQIDDGAVGYGAIEKRDAESALKKFSVCVEWLKNNVPVVCPNGTDVNDIIPLCVNWVAGNLTYDHAAANSGDVMKYQSAYTAFNGSGVGVCSTYASAFTSMVAYVPVEIGSNKVNWDSENIYYLE